MESKNWQATSILNEGQQTNQIKSFLEFNQKTMETLPTCKKQFQGQLDIKINQMEM